MSKFRMKLELQGLKVEIEGSREDAPIIGKNIAEQISGMLKPAVQIVEGEISNQSPVPAELIEDTSTRKIKRRSRPVASGGDKPNAIEFRHDPSKFGMPTQAWSTTQKAIWLLYVVKEQANLAELQTGQIVKLFNMHFRQAKTVTNSNVSRDLGKAKIGPPSLVGEDNTRSPAKWFLTDEGVRFAQALIVESSGQRAA